LRLDLNLYFLVHFDSIKVNIDKDQKIVMSLHIRLKLIIQGSSCEISKLKRFLALHIVTPFYSHTL